MILQAAFLLCFILIHLLAGKLTFLTTKPRHTWLSVSGGIAVAYVFIHIFPELEIAQDTISRGGTFLPFFEHHAYLVAMLGLILFYGLEKSVSYAQLEPKETKDHEETTTSIGFFWLHIASFSIYNALIGYLLVHREEQDLQGLIFFSIAMGLHFLVNDFSLRRYHKNTYQRIGRWVLSAAILIGWLIGLVTHVSKAVTAVLFAFLAGGVILNVLKEELPEERESRFWPFALGASLYSVLLILL